VTFPVVPFDAKAVPFDAKVLTIEFPQASVDGSVTEDGKVITLRADVFFAYNKATLNSKAKAALDRAAARLTELQATTVRVSGYTDSLGTASYNKGLSQRRAKAVLAGLRQRLDGLKGVIKAYGESRPVATNKTAKGRALNRRVTITVTG
jgi:outer membrane protein OmpA-like peptidoglycan-associated protein